MNGKYFRRLASLVVKRRYCPLCGWRGYKFEPFGNKIAHRDDALCPICGSLERHRLAIVLLKDALPTGQRVLHLAPEACLIPWLVSLSCEYVNADLANQAMRRIDLTNIDLPAESKTLIWCSHVLEFIREDRTALREMFRILSPGGLVVLQVPIRGAVTYEDPSVKDPIEQLERFLAAGHVRFYGLDLKQRIEEAGFECEIVSSTQLSASRQALYSVTNNFYREIFLCRKPQTSQR